MSYRSRTIDSAIAHALARGRSLFLFGARQTGKTTLTSRIPAELRISLAQPEVRVRYEKTPGLLRGEIEALKTEGSLPPITRFWRIA